MPSSPKTPLTLALVGVVLLAGRAPASDPLRDVAPILRAAAIAFATQECPLTDRSTPTPHKTPDAIRRRREFLFRGTPSSVAVLGDAGIDVVSLANNHSMDYQTAGLRDTMALLSSKRIAWCGAGEDSGEAATPALVAANGVRVAFLAFGESATTPSADKLEASGSRAGIATVYANADGSPTQASLRRVREAVTRARRLADLVIVSYHWGVEGLTTPTRFQRTLAHKTVESGADLVVGHHPHCLQPVEVHEGKLITYSLGNFLFHPPVESQRETVILLATFRKGALVSAEFVPVRVISGYPKPIEGRDLDSLARIAKRLALPCPNP